MLSSEKDNSSKGGGWFSRLKQGLSRTRHGLTDQLLDLFGSERAIDDNLLEEIEALLLTSDVGVETTQSVINTLTAQVKRKELSDSTALYEALKNQLGNTLTQVHQPLVIDKEKAPFVILMVGINGAGKTTTIGKLAKSFQTQGYSVILAAGDTFRAAAVEQLQAWGERNDVPVVAQPRASDSASVIFDALQSAKARGVDIVIADTAGRLHTQTHLMDELKKVQRVIAKFDGSAPHETLMVIDATTGQNALNQAVQFNEAVGVSGVVLTKLDGTAKGGVVFSMAGKLGLPIRYIGVGEAVEDLQAFAPEPFIAALFER